MPVQVFARRPTAALLVGVSFFAMAAAWRGAQADTIINGSSGQVSVTSGALINNGTITAPYSYVPVIGHGTLTSIANNGTILTASSSPYLSGVSLTGSAAAPTSVGGLDNAAGATILGGRTGLYLGGASIGTLLNSGLLAAAYPYLSTAIAGSVAGGVGASIGRLVNAASGIIKGNTGISFSGGTIGTLVNSGTISASNGWAISVGSSISYYSAWNGSNYTVQSIVTPGAMGALINQSGGSILGGVSLPGNIGTIDNAGLISGSISVSPGTITGVRNATGASIGGLGLAGNTLGTLVNSGTVQARNYGAGVDLGAGTVYSGATGNLLIAANVGAVMNNAGATIAGIGTGLNLSGGTIGTVSNAGVISALSGTGVRAYTASLNSGYWSGQTYVYTNPSITNSIGALINSANATISGNNIGMAITGVVGTIENDGLIAGTSPYYSQSLLIGNGSTIGGLTNTATGTIAGAYSGLIIASSNIGTVSNSGVISAAGGYTGALTGSLGSRYNTATGQWQAVGSSIGSLVNAAGASIVGAYGGVTFNGGTITALTNNGLISGTTIGSGVSNNTGAILAGGHGIALNGATVGTLYNGGVIVGGSAGGGIVISNLSDYTTNGSTLSGAVSGLTNDLGATITGSVGVNLLGGIIGTLLNNGQITGTKDAGISLTYQTDNLSPIVNTLVNAATGTITGANFGVILSQGTLGTLINNGLISGMWAGIEASSYDSYYNTATSPQTIGALTNGGTISATGGVGTLSGVGTAIAVEGVNVGTISNSGLISGASAISSYGSGSVYGIGSVGGTVGLIANQVGGTLLGTGRTAAVELRSAVGVLRNDGVIVDTATGASAAGVAVLGGTLGTLLNSGSGSIIAPRNAVYALGQIGTLANAGVLKADVTAVRLGASSGSYFFSSSAVSQVGTIDRLTNSGTIVGGVNGLASAGQITWIINSGSIVGGSGIGISNLGVAYTRSGTQDGFSQTSVNVTSVVGGTLSMAIRNTGLIMGGRSGIINGEMSALATVQSTQVSDYNYYNPTISTVVNTIGPVGGSIGAVNNAGTILGITVAGIDNRASTAVIDSLLNSGLIQGGEVGIANAGTIGLLSNSGTITGGVAALSNAATGVLTSVSNTGVIAGNITNAAARDLTIAGGDGAGVGTLTGVGGAVGSIGNTASNLVLAGNLALNDNINVGTHTVSNSGNLQLVGAAALTGNYSQTTGTLTAIANTTGYGSLQVSGTASISGSTIVLASTYAYGLTSGAAYTIVAASDAASSYSGLTALAPGYTTAAISTIVAGGQTDLVVTVGSSSLSTGAATIAGGTGTLDVMTGGSLSVTGGTATIGSITNGVVTLTGGSTSLGTISGGSITLASGATIAGTHAVEVTGGTISVAGTVAAPLSVDGGRVSLNGVASGPVTVGGGGTLRGTGTVNGAATVAGVLAPGNSPGTLIFTAGLTQAANSTLSIDIDGTGTGTGAGNYSRVLVTGGGYTIASGATLTPRLRGITGNASNSYSPTLGTDFTVVTAAGGISGSFATVAQPAAGLLANTQFTALTSANAIDLYVTPTYGDLRALGATANQSVVGRVVAGLSGTGGGDLGTALKALYSLPTAGASLDALAQMGGARQSNLVIYSAARAFAATNLVNQRLTVIRDGVSDAVQGTMQATLIGHNLQTAMLPAADDTSAPSVDGRGANAGSPLEDGAWHFWAQGLGVFTRMDGDGNAAGGHSNTGGGMFGGDRALTPDVTVGLAGDIAQSSAGGGNNTTSYGLSGYGNWSLGDAFITGNAGYTYDQYDTGRVLSFGGLNRSATGHTDGGEISAGATVGYRVRLDGVLLEPQAGVQWLQVSRGGYTEKGAGALNLTLHELDYSALQTSLGSRLTTTWHTDGGNAITPVLRAAWLHDFRSRMVTSEAVLAGSSFAVTGPGTGRDGAGVGAGVTVQDGDALSLYANYDGDIRRGETDHVVSAGVRLIW